jgi:hypothetical protein
MPRALTRVKRAGAPQPAVDGRSGGASPVLFPPVLLLPLRDVSVYQRPSAGPVGGPADSFAGEPSVGDAARWGLVSPRARARGWSLVEPDMKDAKPLPRFNGVKVFSATMAQERENLGDRITEWLRTRPHVEVVDTVVTQSSDEAFHCLAITVFFWEELPPK